MTAAAVTNAMLVWRSASERDGATLKPHCPLTEPRVTDAEGVPGLFTFGKHVDALATMDMSTRNNVRAK